MWLVKVTPGFSREISPSFSGSVLPFFSYNTRNEYFSSTPMDYEGILERAFADSENTSIDVPNADMNKIICDSYNVDTTFTSSRTQL